MNKNLKKLATLALAMGLIVSCSKDDENENGSEPVVTVNAIEGTYKIDMLSVATPVDYNGDGVSSQLLLEEDYNLCEYDNYISIDGTYFGFIKKGTTCDENEVDEFYEYKITEDEKGIELLIDNKPYISLTKVAISDYSDKKRFYFTRYDDYLKQDVYYILIEI